MNKDRKLQRAEATIALAGLAALCGWQAASAEPPAAGKPTPAQAERFVQQAESRLGRLIDDSQRAAWVQENFITDDTETINAQAQEQLLRATGELALQSRRFNGLKHSEATARKLKLMQLTLMFPNDADREKYTKLAAFLDGAYGKAKYCPKQPDGTPGKCLALGDMEKILAESRDPAQLKDIWLGWHSQSPSYKQKYASYVDLSNKGARAMGYADTGALWRSGYDMPPEQFAAETERIWQQVKPLYDSLHTYARFKLRQQYGASVVPLTGPIPAHLFGNMWSQSWEYLYPILKPPSPGVAYDLGKELEDRKVGPQEMARYAERFYQSLGMPALPDTFWERSLFTKPQDREVVCHASAWDIDSQLDVRIKMCIKPTEEDFTTIHHELGHIYYFLAYRDLPVLFRAGANDGFHEAIGDTVALSVTSDYLKRVGLMPTEAAIQGDIDSLMRRALEKVAFLPFGYLVDKWRWQVYAGQTTPQDYDRSWWELRERYQGIGRPEPIAADGFDAGAKYHVAADVPYMRYFLAEMLQFQFHRALCREAGYTGPLHRCSIFQSDRAGKKFSAMLALGASRPWPEALRAMTGEDRIDGSAVLEYFAPLKTWLDGQNRLLAEQDKADVKP
jgi:peptidyl-dipeptidase A